jgi:transketolase
MDAVQKANSGHPGLPMGAAPMAWSLWSRHLRHNPRNPQWFNRDRFVLSAGHGSMLLYGLLFATGYDLTLEDIKDFRQWGSRTPGHPENHLTPGVEMATGPLGQGLSTAVGMAIAERFLAATYNKPETAVVDHFTYVICSDGDLMEGVAQEACSLAGHLGLGKLVVLYDDNKITIDGSTDIAFTEDTAAKFQALHWQVIHVKDGHDVDQVDKAILEAKSDPDRPSLIICPTTIGFGSPNRAGTSKSHGSPLGPEEIKLTKANLGMPDQEFWFPEAAIKEFRKAVSRGEQWESEWKDVLASYGSQFEAEATELSTAIAGEWSSDWLTTLPAFDKDISTRQANGEVVKHLAGFLPTLMTGSADLSENVFTVQPGKGTQQHDTPAGRNIAFGVREHAMAAILNGITLHGACIAAGGTFLIFSDYCKPSIRLAALMNAPTIFLFSHDSIGLGEDGPTHQPIEQLAGLRAIPNLNVMRPADANEVAVAWKLALEAKDHPSLIVTCRQSLPVFSPPPAENIEFKNGAYILYQSDPEPQVCLVATGSEVSLAMQAKDALEKAGRSVRVVSMPSWFLFERIELDEREKVLDPKLPTIAIEAGSTMGWNRYADSVIGIDHFGASAPGPVLFEKFGFSVDQVVQRAQRLLSERQR